MTTKMYQLRLTKDELYEVKRGLLLCNQYVLPNTPNTYKIIDLIDKKLGL